MPLRRDSTRILGWTLSVILAVASASCGPPLTQPSSVNLTGRWISVDHIGPVFNLEMTITQNAAGAITGTWVSDVSPPHPACPPELSARSNGTVSGINTVVGVTLAILGTGDFQGQVSNGSTLRGSVLSCGRNYPITFSLAAAAPAG
jgi:hypothetical protein